MHTFLNALSYILTPGHWTSPDGVGLHTWEHIYMTLLSVGLAVLIALPVGLYVGHTRKGEFIAVSVANLGRALPAFGILGIVFMFTLNLPGLGFYPTLIAMTLLAIPPILINTYVGVNAIDEDTVESARGMGMSDMEVLRRIELPLAAPVIVAGIRTGAVAVVATATLAAVFGWGGLGTYIFNGFYQNDNVQLLTGGILVALLAVLTEVSLALVERFVRPRTSSTETRWSAPASAGAGTAGG